MRRVRKRKPQERAEITKRKLIEVALKAFSERGFEAVTLRDIEVLAGVQRNLVSYHFGGKAEIWKAAARDVLTKLEVFTLERAEVTKELPPRERVAYVIRSYVRFSAQHPELNRLLLQEGKQSSWRSEWLMDRFMRPALDVLREAVTPDLALTDEEFMHWYFLIISSGALVFSMQPEAQLLFGADVMEEEFITQHANMMVEFLLCRTKGVS